MQPYNCQKKVAFSICKKNVACTNSLDHVDADCAGRDIGDHDTLADIADSCDMDASVVRRLLDSDADIDAIRSRDAHSREMGVNSVPTFIVAQAHAVPGAQPTDLWLKVIEEIRSRAAEA